jgi:hypothetical protein
MGLVDPSPMRAVYIQVMSPGRYPIVRRRRFGAPSINGLHQVEQFVKLGAGCGWFKDKRVISSTQR